MSESYDPKNYPDQWNYLPSGTIVDQYMIERELASGGFSFVYLARRLKDQTQVAIKEYLPRKQAHRTWNNEIVPNSREDKVLFLKGLSLFYEEAKTLAQLKHENIVEVSSFFRANSTVYMVMNYDYGLGLNKIVINKTLLMDEEFLVPVFTGLLEGIIEMHAHKIVHLDIKPGNILIRPGNSPLLLDFGAIHKFDKIVDTRQALVITNGFSAIEQYSHKRRVGPWTDLYAVGASMRSCLDRKAMQPSIQRLKNDTTIPAVKAYKRKKLPSYLLEAIDWATAVQPSERPQTAQELIDALKQ
ncbi:MAG: serine/threonine protein kinase [Methylococcales bacterium]|nr:serine/threonine protein kinase [Methylococcales bacterium]MCK5924314.1 serine/threonine protein kinase [Methylococcales bacterium]